PPEDWIGTKPLPRSVTHNGMTTTVAAAPSSLVPPVSVRAATLNPAHRWRISWGPLCVAGVLILYVLLIARCYAPAISQPDDNGYFAEGSLPATSGKTWFTTDSDAQYVGMPWLLTPAGNYISRSPPGLAVIVAVVYAVAGYAAATLVNPI